MLERTLVFVKPDHMLLYVPILAMVDPLGNRVGVGLVDKVPTDPSQAGSNTIRGKFSGDSLEKSRAEGRIVRNVLHRSNSPEDAMREIKIWESYINWK